jgi:hypothetical protein
MAAAGASGRWLSLDSDAMPQGTAQYGHLSGVVGFPLSYLKDLAVAALVGGKFHLSDYGVYQDFANPGLTRRSIIEFSR